MLTLCSTSTTAVPVALIWRTISSSCPTIRGDKAERQLVDQQQLGLQDQGLGQTEHLLLAARQRGRQRRSAFVQARECLEALVDQRVDQLPVSPERVSERPQVLDHVHAVEDRPAARDLGDAQRHPALGVEVGDVAAAMAHAGRCSAGRYRTRP